jgi:uncharacterized protein (TIGR04255 family)
MLTTVCCRSAVPFNFACMPFQPINDDHAIQQVTFGLVLGRPLASPTVDTVRAAAAPWRADLPAVEITQVVEVRPDPSTGGMRPVMLRGAEFSFKRPDGTAVSAMTIAGNEIVVRTSRYTRWHSTWATVRSYILDVLNRIVEIEKGRGLSIQSVSLIMVDAFRSSETVPNFADVLIKSAAVPHSIFDRGPLWHSHTGWFVPAPKGRILNQLNIDTKSVTVTDPTSGTKTESPEISITHRQVLEFRPELALGDVVSEEHNTNISEAFEAMHEANKREITGVLTPAMRERIRIDQ